MIPRSDHTARSGRKTLCAYESYLTSHLEGVPHILVGPHMTAGPTEVYTRSDLTWGRGLPALLMCSHSCSHFTHSPSEDYVLFLTSASLFPAKTNHAASYSCRSPIRIVPFRFSSDSRPALEWRSSYSHMASISFTSRGCPFSFSHWPLYPSSSNQAATPARL